MGMISRGADELAQALRAFPDSLPIIQEPMEQGTAQQQALGKEFLADDNSQFYSQKENETFQEVQQENERER